MASALAEIASLEKQLKATAAERDRYETEKSEVAAKADHATRERDDLRIALAAAGADRDRHAAEKTDAVKKAKASAKERDELRGQVTTLTAERDRLASEKTTGEQLVKKVKTAAEQALAKEKAAFEQLVAKEKEAAAQALATARAESERLRHQLENLPPPDPVKVLYDFLAEKTEAAIGKIRSFIPPESPARDWFDKAVALVAEVGCLAVGAIRAFLRWAIPQLLKLYSYLKGEIEARLEKKP